MMQCRIAFITSCRLWRVENRWGFWHSGRSRCKFCAFGNQEVVEALTLGKACLIFILGKMETTKMKAQEKLSSQSQPPNPFLSPKKNTTLQKQQNNYSCLEWTWKHPTEVEDNQTWPVYALGCLVVVNYLPYGWKKLPRSKGFTFSFGVEKA